MNSVSLNQIAYNLLNTLRGGRSSNSEYLDIEQIKYIVKYYRSLFIRRDAQRNFSRLQLFEQDLGLVEVETVDSAEDEDISSAHILQRTTDRIPTPVRLKRKEALTYISAAGKFDFPIPLMDVSRSYWQQFNKYTKDECFAVFKDGYLYIDNDISLEEINVRGVFEDPEQVHKFTRENGFDLYDENSAFPISQDMLEGITKGILNGELNLVIQTPNDTTTDNLQGG